MPWKHPSLQMTNVKRMIVQSQSVSVCLMARTLIGIAKTFMTQRHWYTYTQKPSSKQNIDHPPIRALSIYLLEFVPCVELFIQSINNLFFRISGLDVPCPCPPSPQAVPSLPGTITSPWLVCPLATAAWSGVLCQGDPKSPPK